MQPIHLAGIDYIVLLTYVAFVIGTGWTLARYMKSSADFLTSARSIPTWVTGLAFISANLGALELVGMAASGAKYGIATAHFYWVGAIPAMIFLAVFMMPFYYGSKARSTPEYLKMRFDERVRGLNAIAFAVMTIFASGISMDALAKLLNQLLGWDYNFGLMICSAVVLVYVLICAVPRLFSLFRKKSEAEQRYFEVEPGQRWTMAAVYFGLIAALAIGMQMTYIPPDTLNR